MKEKFYKALAIVFASACLLGAYISHPMAFSYVGAVCTAIFAYSMIERTFTNGH